jgi:ATP-dependent Lhr-like helicase
MDTYRQLAPFIQDYIYEKHWEKFRGIQIKACDIILHSDDNLLLSSGTATGKTEAVFLPVLTKLYEKPSNSIGVLYISPLKALINDQFDRIDELLEKSSIPITKWHGDASKTDKDRIIKNPQGVMQITPESLEAMLMDRKDDVFRLFSDLKYIIIDEVHYFMGEDRGIQLICIIERIQKVIQKVPIRIGLSATLGKYDDAEEWINSGTKRQCQTPIIEEEKRKIRLFLQYFYINSKSKNKEDKKRLKDYYQYLYEITLDRKCIVFSNSKAEVEDNIGNIKKIAKKNNTDDIYEVHHGNISASYREYVEKQMKNSELPIVTGATLSLELGIDLGKLERIVQIGAPISVSSFVQRLGRAGRRGNPSEMWFVFKEEIMGSDEPFYKDINWNFLMCIAMIQLYLEEKWIEPIEKRSFPYGILYHQTMSFMVSAGEIKPGVLAQNILSMNQFKWITQNDYKVLLRYLIENKQLERTENNKLLIGENGEKEINRYEFYSVFEAMKEYSVKCHSEIIGSVQKLFEVGERFALAGRNWESVELDSDAGVIYVKETKGSGKNKWNSEGKQTINQKVMDKIKEIVLSDRNYAYIGESGSQNLEKIRKKSIKKDLTQKQIQKIDQVTFGIFPFLGTKELITLGYALNYFEIENHVYFQKTVPVGIIIKYYSEVEIQEALRKIKVETLDVSLFSFPDKIQISGKFNKFLPDELLKKQYLEDALDLVSLKKHLKFE